ncbi:ABC transporter ATP-binding protein [Microbacterium telephonicum]|uniref:ABC-2 type transport system ATP-binding protein n=1 Tax=Microbacterium telephonicum TaxID=1714841 RepID=A0A498BTD4_9MICO|nr:ABC transporter ATP-binding protein [Microbacterium telephonicum]RLK46702.1 ABC-2 type transport system ATP-binding protein [Microbacterium telephonicum]
MADVIATRALTKHYGRVHALDGLDLTVDEGTVHGFLGPNGAGKSTTIRILLGLARATGGSATVFGRDPWRDAVDLHRRIAYVPGDVSLWPNISGGEAIDLLSRLRGGGRDAGYRAERARLSDAFQFDPRKKGRAYSKGNRQKVALIAAFAVPADLYILDEPTSGLDPLMEVVFRDEIARVAAAGATVLLSSHILSEVEVLCDRVSIIRQGRIVESGTLADMRHLTRTEVSFAATSRATTDAASALPGAEDVTLDRDRVRLTLASDRVTAALPQLATLGVEGLRIAPPSLEELFLRHYGDAPAQATGR